MGHHSHELPDDNWRLWTRGGTTDVYVKRWDRDERILIPAELLKTLVADDVRWERIRKLEGMEDNELLGL